MKWYAVKQTIYYEVEAESREDAIIKCQDHKGTPGQNTWKVLSKVLL